MTFLLSCVVATLATWSLTDIYFYSIFFDGVRERAGRWAESKSRWKALLGYGLQCPYCLSHWVAGVVLLLLWLLPNHVATSLTLLEVILLIPISAKLSDVLRQNVLKPLTASDFSNVAEIGNELAHEVEQPFGIRIDYHDPAETGCDNYTP